MRSFCHIDDDLVLFENPSDVLPSGAMLRSVNIIVILCLKGNAEYSTGTQTHHINVNDVLIINEGQIISDFRSSNDIKVLGIMLSSNFLGEVVKGVSERSLLFLFSHSHPVYTLLENEVRDVVFYYKMIKKKIAETDNLFRNDVVRSLLMTTACDICNVIYRIYRVDDKKNVRSEAIFIDFIVLVERNYKQERRVGWYANQLCITPKHLSETVKQVSRRTPNEWINDYVSMEMRLMLKNTSKSVKEIAHELHFSNQSFFGKYFKEHVGMSPLAYRKK